MARREIGEVRAVFGQGDLRERDHLEDQDVYGRIILKWVFKKLDVGMDWIVLAQYAGTWWTLVNAVMSFRVP